ncbi:amidase family protein [Bordetella petrii]|uniref:Amidase family protein n=1 Tax=Bordetella petrii TaxID=94624 RepID=A0ABT7W3K6_9BORD|nr:amidase family protein [Bordetella petrii]MDM9559735.1 amidase family protein [Bordetella petrii]
MTSLSSNAGARQALQYCIANSRRHDEAARLALLARRDEAALQEADAWDHLRAAGNPAAAQLFGVVLSAKACFDVAGWTTHAGSRVLADDPPARRDAPMVARLRQAGCLLRAQTNMTEFAYGALGLNPWYGTPRTPLATDADRVAGGSSSGAAVATALGMAHLAVCSDTSGSARIPAAFCGVVGFKPSRARYPAEGMLHLSSSFDVPGLMADSAALCRRADRALAPGDAHRPVAPGQSLHGLRLVVPEQWLADTLDAPVAAAFEAWLGQLARAGAQIRTRPLPMLAEAGRTASEGGIIAAEAYLLHAARLADHADRYDARVGPRILSGADVRAHAYALAQARLAELARDYDAAMAQADAVVTPAVPMLPPAIESLRHADAYAAANRRAFQLTEFANRLDLPSITLPGGGAPRVPVGLMFTGRRARDGALLALAERVELALAGDAADRIPAARPIPPVPPEVHP